MNLGAGVAFDGFKVPLCETSGYWAVFWVAVFSGYLCYVVSDGWWLGLTYAPMLIPSRDATKIADRRLLLSSLIGHRALPAYHLRNQPTSSICMYFRPCLLSLPVLKSASQPAIEPRSHEVVVAKGHRRHV